MIVWFGNFNFLIFCFVYIVCIGYWVFKFIIGLFCYVGDFIGINCKDVNK